LADELLFGKLVHGGNVHVDIDDKDQVKLVFEHKAEHKPASPKPEAETV
jgi:ATP-dependent Clp protease ATP-binding subunit ClpA